MPRTSTAIPLWSPPRMAKRRWRRRTRPFTMLLVASALCGCQADALPYRLELERQLIYDSRPVDLDGDGVDELYYTFVPSGRRDLESVVLLSRTGATIDQVNYTGDVGRVHFLDVEGDRRLEMLVSMIRNDSAFVSVVDAQGRKLYSFFLAAGRPRVEPEGVMPWDFYVYNAAVHDFDGDGRKELVTVVFTAFARMPRGVLVHSLPDGTLLGEFIIGAGARTSIIDDFDGDGDPEVLIASATTNNGARAGGFDDSRAHVILVDVWPSPRVSWHRTLPRESGGATIAFEDFDGDQRRELLVASFGDRAGSLELLDPRTWQTLRLRQIEAPTRPAAVVDVDHDGRPEIVVPSQPRDVLLFDDDFELLRRLRSSIQVGPVLVVQDLDGDAVNEMVVQGSETLLLGPRLQPKAIVPIILTEAVALRRGPDLPRGLVVQTPQGSTRMFVLRRTPFYLARQYGPWAAGPAGTAALLLAGMATVRARRRRRVLETLHAVSRERDGARLLVLDRAGRILWANDAMRDWCTGGGGAAALGGTVDRLAPAAPELAAFCRECIATKPPRDVVAPAPIRGGRADASPLRASARPALTGSRTDPHWVVRLDDPAAAAALDLQAAWAPLARRIAHDLRNPLTSVLLTLKRMQIEYREAAPEAVPRLDAYNERVQERVDHLRRLTSNFLKLLGEERPHCEKHDLNDIVRAAADGIGQGLPPDVRIVTRLAADLPSVAADREQLESVLENLVANAVNAMPHGGAITLATHAATGLDVGGAGPRDYVQLEVLDTGTGIEPADLGLVFDAGFTRGEHGSGLGLAIVRKIVQDHGGYASVESEPGAGTVFTILLPAWRDAAGGPAA